MGVDISPCEYARERHQNIARWRNLWSILLFAFGTAVVLFLIVSIFLFLGQSWLPGAVSTLGTIASGAAMTWVTRRRVDAMQEEELAYKEVVARCGQGPAPMALPKDVQDQIEEFSSSLRLVGRFR